LTQFNSLESLNELTIEQQKEYNDLFIAKCLLRKLVKQIDEAKGVYRDKEKYYDLNKLASAKRLIDSALEVISLAHSPTHFSLTTFEMSPGQNSIDDIERATADKSENLFVDFYASNFIEFAKKHQPDVIAISIVSNTQLIPGLTLSRMLKESGIKSHIVVGGTTITCLKDSLYRLGSKFGEYFDSAIFYEGERPLLELVRCLENKQHLGKVPNLMFLDNGKIVTNEINTTEDIDLLPTPEFDGLPLKLYFSPDLVLPILASRGCYWSKCAFCSHGLIYNGTFRTRSIDKLINDFRTLSLKYQTKNFAFSDECISPHTLRLLSEKLIEADVQIKYSLEARFEKQFTRSLYNRLAESGLKIIYFGFESGCERLLNFMHKGISLDTAVEVCRNAHDAGIWNHLFIFFGFPTETLTEAQETADFLILHKDIIRSFSGGSFVLSKGSEVSNHPENYGIVKEEIPNYEFQVTYDYATTLGISQQQAKTLSEEIVDKIYKEYPSNSLIDVLGQDNLLHYLIHFENTDPFLISATLPDKSLNKIIGGTKKQITGKSIPTLHEHIVCESVRYNILEIRNHITHSSGNNVIPRVTNIIYDIDSGMTREITQTAKEILDLCDGMTTVTRVAKALAAKYRQNVTYIQDECSSFLKEMISNNVVFLKN